jgi:uncharacterized protein
MKRGLTGFFIVAGGLILFPMVVLIVSLLRLSGQSGVKQGVLPVYESRVNDLAEVISEDDEKLIENYCDVLETQTGAQLAVLTVNSVADYGSYGSLDEFSLAVATAWALGQADKDNGALLCLAVKDRDVKIELGYGLEGIIPDSAAGRILDNNVLPFFAKDDFSAGLVQGALAIANAVSRSESGVDIAAETPLLQETSEDAKKGSLPVPFIIILFGFSSIAIMVLSIIGHKKGWSGGSGSSGSSGGWSSGGSSHSSGGGGSFGGGGAGRHF